MPTHKVFISGCYDILHAGHIQFFTEARAVGNHLTVCFASDNVLWHHKERRSSIPQAHKKALLESLRMVDEVVIGECEELGLDFKDHFLRIRPDFLVVTEDDKYTEAKKALCAEVGAQYVKLEKTPPLFEPVSTSQIVRYIRAPQVAPLRVDFAGGWLDVPRFSRRDGYIVNCAISPTVSLRSWPYEQKAGLGGSGAWALLNGLDGVTSELNLGVGWQDPAVIREGGCCVWKSGHQPQLEIKVSGDFLRGRMALLFTGSTHDTAALADKADRNFELIAESGRIAREGVWQENIHRLAEGIKVYYASQLDEGMRPLDDFLNEPSSAIACKYCGSGHGGYAVFLFNSEAEREAFVAGDTDNRQAIEPWTHFTP
jgi:cytidyltransferase-like protein